MGMNGSTPFRPRRSENTPPSPQAASLVRSRTDIKVLSRAPEAVWLGQIRLYDTTATPDSYLVMTQWLHITLARKRPHLAATPSQLRAVWKSCYPNGGRERGCGQAFPVLSGSSVGKGEVPRKQTVIDINSRSCEKKIKTILLKNH